ncbi:MAG: DUF3253 domain-containing protein [Pseudomonadota bacterium]
MTNPTDELIAETIIRLCTDRGAEKTICPSEVARSLEPEEARWRSLLPHVRRVAGDLSDQDGVWIFRKGRRIERDQVRGVIRLGLPRDRRQRSEQ